MPSFDPYHHHSSEDYEDADDDFSVFAPAAINNADYVEDADLDDLLLLPSATNDSQQQQRRRSGGGGGHHACGSGNRRRRNRGYVFSWCLDAQSDSSSAASIVSGEEEEQLRRTDVEKPTCGRAKHVLGRVLSNVVVSVAVILLTLGISAGLLYFALFKLEPKPSIDKSVSSFQIPNHNATRRQDAFEQARKELAEQQKQTRHSKRSSDLSDSGSNPANILDRYRNPDDGSLLSESMKKTSTRNRRQTPVNLYPQSSRYWKINVVYLAQGSSDPDDPDRHNIFTAARLQQIHDIEMSIMRQPRFMDFCYKNYAKILDDPNLSMFNGCAPLNSLMTYFYPSVELPSGRVHYDGLGSSLEDIDKTLQFAMTRETFYWYVDDRLNTTYRKSKILRTEIQFGRPLPSYLSGSDRKEEQQAKYLQLMKSYVELLKKSSTSQVKVLYGGTEVFDYQVESIFWADVQLAVFSLVAITLLMYVLTSLSVWLTVWGLVSIVVSFPMAFFLYRAVFGLASLGLLNGAAAFVIIGIGVDDVFVFINTFRQASHIGNHGDRLAHTLTTAGLATFFTSFTTAAAFAANIASAIPAVYEFGLFMSLIVTCCWLSVMLIMPAAINIWVRGRLALCEHRCYSRCSCGSCGSSLALPPDMENFLADPSGRPGTWGTSQGPPEGADGDVPLMGMDEEEAHGGGDGQGGWMVYFGMLKQAVHSTQGRRHADADDDPLLQLEGSLRVDVSQQTEGCGLTRHMQALLYFYVARPVIRVRWLVFALFFVLLAVSAGLMSQLKPSQTPPQLFRPSSNLQQLIDLTANFSDSGIHCYECSAFYKEGSVIPDDVTRPHTLAPPTMPKLTTTTTTTTTPSAATPSPATKIPLSTSAPTTAETTATTTLATASPSATTTATTTSSSLKTTTTTITATTTTTSDGKTASPSTTTSSLSTTTTEGNIVNPATPTPSGSQSTTPSTTTTTTTTAVPSSHPQKPSTKASTPTPTPTPTPAPTPAPPLPHPTRKPSPAPAPSNGPVGTSPPSPTAYDPCAFGKCDDTKERPNLEVGAAVFVVFGITGIDRSNVSTGSVITEKGSVVYDNAFEAAMTLPNINRTVLRDLCRICSRIANNSDLVKANGSQCLPTSGIPGLITTYLKKIPECANLPENHNVNGRQLPAKAQAGMLSGKLIWIAFAFDSTTYKGQSYFQAYNDFQRWEAFMEELRTDLGSDSPLRGMCQTSEFWKDVMMEVVAVTSAIYGLLFSLIICVAAVAIFTGHFLLLLIVFLTIIGEIALVVAIFYLAGWELGAVEAVSLSILVGTSVDYCMHLVEGYILAGRNYPPELKSNPAALRKWRTAAAISHIGVSILSSAVTTIIAAIPLTLTTIRPFAKFGEIVAINTTVSIVYTLTVCTAFLAVFAPARYRITWRSVGVAFAVTAAVVSGIVLALYGAARMGVAIPGPSGNNLFHTKLQ